MAAARYFVIGKPLQVMNKSMLSHFPTTPKTITDADIIASLKPNDANEKFLVFTNFLQAKEYVLIEARNDDINYVNSVKTTTYSRPVIEITLVRFDIGSLTDKKVNVASGTLAHLRADALETKASNIKQIRSYYILAHGRNTSTTLSMLIDFQQELQQSRKCSIM
jgi:hypothetical protein